MKDKIYNILKHSAFYSFGNIALKGMGIITLPIYASYLTQREFGIFATLEITIIILAEILTLGQANSIIYFNNSKDYSTKNKSTFFTITLIVLAANIIFAGLAFAFKASFQDIFISSSIFTIYFPFIISVSLFRALTSVFINKLRADEKSLFYTLITLIRIVTFIGLIFYTVVYLKLSVTGIMYSFLVGEIIILLIILPAMITKMRFAFDKEIGRQALKYGFPLIFSAIGIYILNLSDRFLIRYYLDYKSVGIYDFAYRISGIILMFLIIPFNQALLPSTYKAYKLPGDKRYYSKLMTYMCFVIVWGGLTISMFGSLIVKILGTNNFRGAEIFVPVIILAYVFSAMRNVASIGMLLSEKTFYLALIAVAAGILNILLNIVFIPLYGVIAAAYTTLAAFFIFYLITKYLSDRFYDIPYESIKILKLLVVGIVLFIISEMLPLDGIVLSSAVKLIIAILFPFTMYYLNFYEEIELRTIKTSLHKLKNPLNWKNIIMSLITNEK